MFVIHEKGNLFSIQLESPLSHFQRKEDDSGLTAES